MFILWLCSVLFFFVSLKMMHDKIMCKRGIEFGFYRIVSFSFYEDRKFSVLLRGFCDLTCVAYESKCRQYNRITA